MPRRNRTRRPADRERRGGFAAQESVEWRGEEWTIRRVAGDSGKSYRCPGCDQEIRSGVGHVVAWPAQFGTDDRRHWHTACWQARDRRQANVKRSRDAPRY